MASNKEAPTSTESYDLIIIGAGISGINCAYRLQTQLPHIKFAILENRNGLGGTWDLFKYPGIRSDSDLHTFGFPWHPWPYESPIAEAPLILSYLKECVSDHGLGKYMNFRHNVLSGDWSSKSNRWTLDVESDGRKKAYTAKFIVLGAGYYDYNNPLKVEIPGLERFQGKVIHPQFWPTEYDHTDKKIVVIGSGATAITLLPSLAKTAAHVTMLQRSPSYIVVARQTWSALMPPRRWWPSWLLSTYERWWFIIVTQLFYLICQWFPKLTKKGVQSATLKLLPSRIALNPNFEPKYYPWQQRLCYAPDGDFYEALHTPKADVVTSKIKTVTEGGIELEIGEKLEADVIVTATGIRMQFGGGIPLRVDGEQRNFENRFIWNGAMLQDIPNMFYMVGYTNASWTLGADETAFIICRLLKKMESRNVQVAIPRLPKDSHMRSQPAWLLNSTYAKAAEERLPKYGDRGPWKPRYYIVNDYVHSRWGNVTNGLHFAA